VTVSRAWPVAGAPGVHTNSQQTKNNDSRRDAFMASRTSDDVSYSRVQ
jgi:hypothetical protein